MFNGLLQPTHLIIILVIVLIIFGPRKLPEIGSAVGKSIREFRKSTHDMTKDFKESVDDIKRPIDEIRQSPMDMKPAGSAPTAAAVETGRVCPKCSAGNVSSSKFCGACGAQLA